jgi:hypothetical protein
MDSLSSKVVLGITAVVALSALSATVITLTGEDSGRYALQNESLYQPVAAELAPSGLSEIAPRFSMPWSEEWYHTQKALRDNAAAPQDIEAF